MESVNVISPFVELTFTDPTATILVESYTLPVNQTCDLAWTTSSSSIGRNSFNVSEWDFRRCKYRTDAHQLGLSKPK